MRLVLHAAAALLVAVALGGAASAQNLGFETLPNGAVPLEQTFIGAQYAASHGLTFSLLGGGLPTIAQWGDQGWAPGGVSKPWAFYGFNGVFDAPAPGQGVGAYYLTDANIGGAVTLVIDYSCPVQAASGVLLDVDAGETFTITAFDAFAASVGSVTIDTTSPGTGNALATPWTVSSVNSAPDIVQVRITTPGAGFVIDNLSPACVCNGTFIDFEALADPLGTGQNPQSVPYFEEGYELTASSLFTYGGASQFSTGSTAVHGTDLELKRVIFQEGFRVCGLDIAEEHATSPLTAAFTNQNGTFWSSFALDGVRYVPQRFFLQQLPLPGVTALRASDGVQLDNLCICGDSDVDGIRCRSHNPGLVAWWSGDSCRPVDEERQHHGTVSGSLTCEPAPGAVGGGALQFDRTKPNSMSVPDHPDLEPGNEPLSVVLKVTPSEDALIDSESVDVPILSKGGAYILSISNREPLLTICAPLCFFFTLPGNPQLQAGATRSIAFAIDPAAGTCQFQMNGVAAAACGFTPFSLGDAAPLVMGSGFDGLIDEVEVYRRFLNATEIASKFSDFICRRPRRVTVNGTGGGGEVHLSVAGVDVGVTTLPGASAAQVASDLTDAINDHTAFEGTAVAAIQVEANVVTGPVRVLSASSSDPGLTVTLSSPVPVPSLPHAAIGGLALLVAGLGALLALRSRGRGQP